MANVKLRIEITADDSLASLGEISTDNMELANTSIKPNADGVFSAFPNNNNATSGLNTLTYGQELCFNDKDELDNIDGFGAGLDDEKNHVEVVWGIVNEDKSYNVTIKFTDAIDLKSVVVYGDNASKQFPTKAILDAGTEFEKEIFSDDYTWSIAFENASNEHTIQFTHWNRANYNAVLTLIDVMLQNYEVDIYNGLKSVESLSQSSSDTTGIFYGSIESSGSAEILDKNGELGDLLTDGIIDNSNVPITVLVNGKQVQHHISTDSSYNKNSKTLSIELGNRLNTLDVLKYKGYDYPDHSENLANLLFDVLSNLRYALFGKDKQLDEEEFKEMLSSKYNATGATLYEYLTWLEVEYPVIEANKTYREVLDEFCLIAQMQMYIDDDNNVKFVSARPIITDADFQSIHIPKKNMFSQPDYAVILKNKYDGVEGSITYGQKNYEDEIFTSETLLVYDKDKNYIAENEGINPNEYKFSHSDIEYLSYISFQYTYNLNDCNKAINPNNFDDIKLKITMYQHNYTYNVNIVFGDNSYTSDNGNGTEVITLSAIDVFSPTTQKPCFTKSIDGTNVTFNIYLPKGGLDSGGYDTGSYPYSFINEVSFSILKTTISFEQVQSNTENIELAKTKVSIGSSNLIQNDYTIDTIKSNITEDYKQGISNASVSISCNDYFDSDGKKVVDWAKGQLPQVEQIVYFDNDLYKDQSQRYWKIKGRNFRKTGVPMVDLELEETKKSTTLGDFRVKYTFDSSIDGYTVQANVPLTNTTANEITGNLVILEQYNDGINGLKDIKKISHDIHNSNLYGGGFEYSNLTSIKIADNIEKIDVNSFRRCSILTDVIFSQNSKLKYLGDSAFNYCTSLKNINLPSGITYLGSECFNGCKSLEQVKIPTSIDTLKQNTFASCSSLKTIFIPKNIENIIIESGTSVFWGCDSSLVIYCEAASKPNNWDSYWDVYKSENYSYKHLTVKWGYTYEQYVAETRNI